MTHSILTAARAREVLEYNSETGELHWKIRLSIRAPAGTIAGTRMKIGYIAIGIDGHDYYAHRIAWLITHGRWPTHQIDHINGIRTDNRLNNLREASNGHNAVNKKRPRRDNKSGETGVYWDKAREMWIVCIGKKFSGRFRLKEDAINHRQKLAKKIFGEFFPHN